MAMSLLQAHAAVADPHGDRAYADDTFATQVDVSTLSESVSGLGDRVVDIETGNTPVSGINAVGPVTVSGANLTVADSDKGYRFRVDGAALRSEEHTSELQSLIRISYAVFCLKKNKIANT